MRTNHVLAVAGASGERQMPFVFQDCQPHRSQRSSASTSHSAHANITARYTHIGSEITLGCGSADSVRSRNHANDVQLDPGPVTPISGHASKLCRMPENTSVPTAMTVSA